MIAWYPLLIKRGLLENPPFISMAFPSKLNLHGVAATGIGYSHV